MPEWYVPKIRQRWEIFGDLAPVFAHEGLTDVLVNGDVVWVDAGHGLVQIDIEWSERPVELARRLISAAGRHVDEITPIADGRIGQVRVHVVLAPIASPGPLLSLRVFRAAAFTLEEFVKVGTLQAIELDLLREAVIERRNILVTGGTGSGKTTMLRSLLSEVDAGQRIITVEDVAEIAVDHPHAISLESRQPNIEGAGGMSLTELTFAAMRMRPDWLVIGECRGPEIQPFLSALNTGHAGGGTLHANTLEDVPARLESLGRMAGMSERAIRSDAASAIDLVLHLARTDRGRRCTGVSALRRRGTRLEMVPVRG